jgi:uncharacterized membrane protein
MERTGPSSFTIWITLLAILTALTTVATLVLVVPIPATGGIFNVGDIMVMISGLLLGPVGGFVAGGAGSMFADLVAAPGFAPITLVVKGLEGMTVGYFSKRTADLSSIGKWDVVGVVVGSIMMLLGYFIAETALAGGNFGPALVELITGNILQVTAGSVVTLLAGPRLRYYLASLGKASVDMDESS